MPLRKIFFLDDNNRAICHVIEKKSAGVMGSAQAPHEQLDAPIVDFADIEQTAHSIERGGAREVEFAAVAAAPSDLVEVVTVTGKDLHAMVQGITHVHPAHFLLASTATPQGRSEFSPSFAL